MNSWRRRRNIYIGLLLTSLLSLAMVAATRSFAPATASIGIAGGFHSAGRAEAAAAIIDPVIPPASAYLPPAPVEPLAGYNGAIAEAVDLALNPPTVRIPGVVDLSPRPPAPAPTPDTAVESAPAAAPVAPEPSPAAAAPTPAPPSAPAPVSAAPVSIPTPEPPAAPAPAPSVAVALQPQERALFDMINAQRQAAGLAPLALDAQLVDIARARSNEMVQQNYFGHVSPQGDMRFATLLNERGVAYSAAGENLARNNYPLEECVRVAVEGFLNSPAHREIMFRSHYLRVGVGLAVTADGMKVFTVIFVG